jgi:3-phenylpropionate/trans-cinnamate dioxygenase ferredoxin subunit
MFKRKVSWQIVFFSEEERSSFFGNANHKIFKSAFGEFLLVNKNDGVHAFKSRCPHQNKPLNGCILKDEVIICPFHKYEFSMRDGKGHGMCLEKYPTKLEEEKFFVGKERWSLF